MKQFFSLLALSVFAFAGCGDKDNTPNPLNPSSGSLSAKIDGTSWNASLAVQAVKASGTLQVTGSDNAAKQLNVTIMAYTGPGTYALGGAATSGNGNTGRWTAGLNPEQTYSTIVGQGEGTCTIKEEGGKVEGTFSFTAKNTEGEQVTVTEGTFSVKP